MLIESKNVIIIPNRKTGLMSIVDALESSNLFTHPDHQHAYACGTLDFYNHPDYFEEFPNWPGESYILNEKVVNSHKFYLTVRNPFDKMVSSFFFFNEGEDIFGQKMTFDEFVNRLVTEEISFNTKIHTIVPSLDYVKYNMGMLDFKVIRFESLKDDFYSFCLENNLDAYKRLKHINISQYRKSKEYRFMYNKKNYNIVKQLFEKDIDYFKYQF